jgi:FlaA1/EpsC-like NDP-sugar epimerase
MEQIAKGGPITVTHPEIRRYFMTIPEAVTLVLQAATVGQSGQILILDMGDPIKIVDLARQLLRLVGKTESEVPIEFVGLRPGEKLFEELSCDGESCLKTSHDSIWVFDQNGARGNNYIERAELALRSAFDESDSFAVQHFLMEIVPEYEPRNGHQLPVDKLAAGAIKN